jgi:hypothetical protein
MTKVFDPMQTAVNAIENASTVPVARDDIKRLLSTGEGEGSHLRALFGDVDLHTLLRLATLFDIDDLTLVRAYARARQTAAAANAEMDEYASTYGL